MAEQTRYLDYEGLKVYNSLVRKYDTKIDEKLAMPNDVGGIKKGTTAGVLSGKTFVQIFDDLLFPTIEPVSTDGTEKLTVKDASLVEIGAKRVITGTTTFTQGSWTNGGTYRGEATNYKFSVNDTEEKSGTESSCIYSERTFDVGTHTYQVEITYGAGSIPKDNKGTTYPDMQNTGNTVNTNATIKCAWPVFSSTNAKEQLTDDTIDKKILVEGKTFDIQFGNEITNKKFSKFIYPSTHELIKIEVYNPNSANPWITQDSSYFKTIDNITKKINGVDYTYRVWTRESAENPMLTNDTRYRFTLNKSTIEK